MIEKQVSIFHKIIKLSNKLKGFCRRLMLVLLM